MTAESRSTAEVHRKLSEAVARVAALYDLVPESRRPDVCGERWSALDHEIDGAIASGDRARALSAIQGWEDHARRVLGALA